MVVVPCCTLNLLKQSFFTVAGLETQHNGAIPSPIASVSESKTHRGLKNGCIDRVSHLKTSYPHIYVIQFLGEVPVHR